MLQEQPRRPSLEKCGKKEYNFFFSPLNIQNHVGSWVYRFFFSSVPVPVAAAWHFTVTKVRPLLQMPCLCKK